MCLGARKLHPRLDSRVGKQGSRGREKGAMLSLRNALSYGVRGRPLSSGTPTRVSTRIHRRKMQWSRKVCNLGRTESREALGPS